MLCETGFVVQNTGQENRRQEGAREVTETQILRCSAVVGSGQSLLHRGHCSSGPPWSLVLPTTTWLLPQRVDGPWSRSPVDASKSITLTPFSVFSQDSAWLISFSVLGCGSTLQKTGEGRQCLPTGSESVCSGRHLPSFEHSCWNAHRSSGGCPYDVANFQSRIPSSLPDEV